MGMSIMGDAMDVGGKGKSLNFTSFEFRVHV